MAETSEIFTDAAYEVLIQAHDESRQTGHQYVGPEQLLVGLLIAGAGPAREAFQTLEISVERTREGIRQLVGIGVGLVPNRIPYTHKLQRILDFGYGLAKQMGYERAAPEHLVLGLTQEGDGVVARVLKQMGCSLMQIQTELLPHMPPILTEKSTSTRLYESLSTWLEPYSIGRVWRPIQEIRVVTGDLIVGDVLFCLDPKQCEQMLPDMVIQVCTKNRTPAIVRAKLQFLLSVGIRIGILLDPSGQRAEVHRLDQDPEVFGEGEILKLPELLPGWGVSLDKLWLSPKLELPAPEEKAQGDLETTEPDLIPSVEPEVELTDPDQASEPTDEDPDL